MPETTAELTSTPRAPRLAVLGAFAACGAAAGSWGSRIPDIRAELDLSEGALGTALLGLSIGAVSGSWSGGLLVRRYGSRAVVGAAWIATGATVTLPGIAPSGLTLGFSLLALGLSIGVLDVSMNGAGVQLEHAAGRSLLNGLHAGWSGGVLAGAAIGSGAVALDVAPSWHLLIVGLLIAGLGAGAMGYVPDGRASALAAHHEAAEVPPTRGRGSSGRRLAALAAIGGCVFLAEGAVLDWAGVFVREDLGGEPILGSVAVTGASAGGLLGRMVGDRLAGRFGAVRLVRAGALLALVGLGSSLLMVSPVPVPILLVVLGAGLAPAVPLAFAAAGRRHGEHGIAVVTTAGYGAYLAGPAAIGWIADGASLRIALLVPLVLVAAVIPLAWSTD
jgi:MFS family permease